MFSFKFFKITLFFWLVSVVFLSASFSFADTIEVGLEVQSGGVITTGGPVYGCTDPLALNFNPLADTDNGSCLYSSGVPNVSNFNASFNNLSQVIDLSWDNPIFAEFSAVRIVRKIGSIPLDETDGILIYDNSGESATENNISVSGTYFYTAFVRNNTGDYSSGVITQVVITDNEDNIPIDEPPISPGGGGGSDPFNDLPLALKFDPITNKLSFGDFIFFQAGELSQFFGRGSQIKLNGQKPFTISLPYNKVPEALKIIGVTISYPNNNDQVFSFLLRLNQSQTSYEATINPLPGDGIYPINIYIVNFDNQTLKKINGALQVSATGVLSPPIISTVLKKAVAPLVVGAGVVAGASQALFLASSGASSLADLYLLLLKGFGALLGFLGIRRRHKPWGTVYDAVTKQPIDPAYVTVEKLAEPDKEVASAITDIDGRYGFFLPAGAYKIKAGKTHYQFPSQKLAGHSADELYGDLYFGEAINTDGQEVLNKNIPLDPIGFDWNEFTKNKSTYFKVYSDKEIKRARIFNIIYGLGFISAFISMVVSPGVINLLAVFVYLALFVFSFVWQRWHKPVTVKWQKSGEPIPFAIIRFFLTDLSQEVKHIVTDNLGRFYTLLRPGKYYFTVEEKMSDGSYRKVYQSDSLELKKGVLNKDVSISDSLIPETKIPFNTEAL